MRGTKETTGPTGFHPDTVRFEFRFRAFEDAPECFHPDTVRFECVVEKEVHYMGVSIPIRFDLNTGTRRVKLDE